LYTDDTDDTEKPLKIRSFSVFSVKSVYQKGLITAIPNEPFFFGGGGGNFRRGIDEETLKQVAAMTGGAYFAASSTGELQEVFSSVPVQIMTVTETTEISVIFAALGAVFVMLAILLSMIWHPIP
jgi:hypothetical protein